LQKLNKETIVSLKFLFPPKVDYHKYYPDNPVDPACPVEYLTSEMLVW
jgi:hypothetical protein